MLRARITRKVKKVGNKYLGGKYGLYKKLKFCNFLY